MSHPCVSLLAPPAPQGLALPQDGAPGKQVLAVLLEMLEAQDLVSFDIVLWHPTEQEGLSLSLSPEQQALVFPRAVTSTGVHTDTLCWYEIHPSARSTLSTLKAPL